MPQSELISLYNFNGVTVLYYFIQNIHDLIYRLNHYINRIEEQTIVYVITNPYKENINFDFIKDKNIILLQTEINFELFYNLHILRHDYFYKNKIINTENILDIFNEISVSWDKYPKASCYNRSGMFVQNLKNELSKTKNTMELIKQLDTENKLYEQLIEYKPIENLEHYNFLLEEINIFLIENVEVYKNKQLEFKEYASIYNFEKHGFIWINCIPKNITLENVYYINKRWFDKDKKQLEMEEFDKDFEYKEHKNCWENSNWPNLCITDITKIPVYQEIEEEVMFLDYIYGFYNFGEFWDVIKRLLLSKKKNLPLFHLSYNRITNIEYYFDKLQFKYPTNYQTQEGNKKLYFFNKINISLVKNAGCRGIVDRYFGYEFNKLLNSSKLESEKTYNIYLARGQYGRSIKNESQIVDVLKKKYNFIVLNGTEKMEETIHYFTNAKIILGAHGSLMKNMIWSKKTPILIELCPPTRHDCFYGNAKSLGFLSFFVLTDSNESEQIILNDEQIGGLYKLLDKLL